jgi:PAS domain S-box-containing protein
LNFCFRADHRRSCHHHLRLEAQQGNRRAARPGARYRAARRDPAERRQLDKLFSVIERSQQGYRDLIDSFDDVLIAVTLDGEVRAANRSFADLVGCSFQEIVGHPLAEFIEDGGGDGPDVLERHLPRFLENRHWTGVIQVRLRKRNTITTLTASSTP